MNLINFNGFNLSFSRFDFPFQGEKRIFDNEKIFKFEKLNRKHENI